jgi:hypothetical protein
MGYSKMRKKVISLGKVVIIALPVSVIPFMIARVI